MMLGMHVLLVNVRDTWMNPLSTNVEVVSYLKLQRTRATHMNPLNVSGQQLWSGEAILDKEGIHEVVESLLGMMKPRMHRLRILMVRTLATMNFLDLSLVLQPVAHVLMIR